LAEAFEVMLAVNQILIELGKQTGKEKPEIMTSLNYYYKLLTLNLEHIII